MAYVIGVDTGGTFTDCVVLDDAGRVYYDKARSTPDNLAVGVLAAVDNAAAVIGLDRQALLRDTRVFAHGTTAGLNKLFTRTGARVGLIATRGHEDAILIGRVFQKVAGRGEREITDAVHLDKAVPLVPRELIRGVTERMDYKGAAVVALDRDEAATAIRDLIAAGVDSLAICLLWSFMNPSHEQALARLARELRPDLYLSVSSELVPLLKEYERTATTVVNAYLGPTLHEYVLALDARLQADGLRQSFFMMQSMGGVLPAAEASQQAVNTLRSGPVGGVVASIALGEALGHRNIIATDVGGTSFDVGLVVDGEPQLARAPVVEQYHLLVPMVDVVSIGAGGGSIAWIEPHSGLLRVGPHSAGAQPGPVCYGAGGTEPTVADADLVLGRLNPDYFFGGRTRLDVDGARRAIAERIAEPLGLDVVEAARGIVEIVDAHMADLVRKVTIERGYDPRDFVLYAYGGGGPTHVGAYARDLGVRQAVVSPYAAALSALGIAASDLQRFYVKAEPMVASFARGEPADAIAGFARSDPADVMAPSDLARINAIYADLERQAAADLQRAGFGPETSLLVRSVELRFRRQTNELAIRVPPGPLGQATLAAVLGGFEAAYERVYGPGTAYKAAGIELASFRLTAIGRLPKPALPRHPVGAADPRAAQKGERPVFFGRGFEPTPLYDPELLRAGQRLAGPAIVEGRATTVVIHPGQRASVDPYLNLVIEEA
jgi:N-methylhydantoinase A